MYQVEMRYYECIIASCLPFFHFTGVKWHASVKTLALVKQLIIMILFLLKLSHPMLIKS